jgi:hypothetical protein
MFGGAAVFIVMVICGVAWMNSGPTVPAKATTAQQEAPALDDKRPIFVGQKGAILCPNAMLDAAVINHYVDKPRLDRLLVDLLSPTATPAAEAIADGCKRIEPGARLYDGEFATLVLHTPETLLGFFAVNIRPQGTRGDRKAYVTSPDWLTNSP